MYALPNKTQHKLIVKVRGEGSWSQKLDNFTSKPNSGSTPPDTKLNLDQLPQPVFHPINQHGKPRSMSQRAQKQQYISPEHNEMIKYFQQSWKGVERDYKKSFITGLDINQKKKTGSISTPLLLTGSYHHTSSFSSNNSANNRQDSFQPFDLEAFWGNRMFKRLTEES